MLVIGIAGGTGCGKSTVVSKIIQRLPDNEIAVLPVDAYYKDNGHLPLDERQEINFDHPESLEFDLLVDHIKMLKDGAIVERPIYSYLTCTRDERTVTVYPRDVVIVEGILLLTHKIARELCNIKIYVDAPADDRLLRVIKRDLEHRGRDVETVLHRYEQTVKPMHEQFIEPTKKYADIIVPQGGENHVAIDVLVATIMNKLREIRYEKSSSGSV